MEPSYRFVVNGRVQGVFFRQSTLQKARRLGLRGWVRNRADGAVEGVAAGSETALAALHEWLHRGPPQARVDAVEWTPSSEPVPAADFEVRP